VIVHDQGGELPAGPGQKAASRCPQHDSHFQRRKGIHGNTAACSCPTVVHQPCHYCHPCLWCMPQRISYCSSLHTHPRTLACVSSSIHGEAKFAPASMSAGLVLTPAVGGAGGLGALIDVCSAEQHVRKRDASMPGYYSLGEQCWHVRCVCSAWLPSFALISQTHRRSWCRCL
jgi:hypothetical protein